MPRVNHSKCSLSDCYFMTQKVIAIQRWYCVASTVEPDSSDSVFLFALNQSQIVNVVQKKYVLENYGIVRFNSSIWCMSACNASRQVCRLRNIGRMVVRMGAEWSESLKLLQIHLPISHYILNGDEIQHNE